VLDKFTWRKAYAIARKEAKRISRSPTVLGMILIIPVVQIVLFGYAINVNPRHLPTVVINYDNSQFTKKFVSALQNTKYFAIKHHNISEKAAKDKLKNGDVMFIVHIPSHFTYRLLRGEQPHILLESDSTDPVSVSAAISAINSLVPRVFKREFTGGLARLQAKDPSFVVDVHNLYNPNVVTTYYVVPGLIGIILTLWLTILTSGAIVVEKEDATIETILNSTINKYEYFVGVMLPYLIVGYLQMTLILLIAYLLFDMPPYGGIFALYIAALPFILANLMIGLLASAISDTLLQAQQYVVFFFLPSFLLSGFVFPFYGMPYWAQVIGNMLPLTHFLQITRGLFLKGFTWYDVWINIWPILVFLLIISAIAMLAHKKTLD